MPKKYYERTSLVSTPPFTTSPIHSVGKVPASTIFNNTLSGDGREFNFTMVFTRNNVNKTECMAFVKNRSYSVLERMKLIQDYNCKRLGDVRNFNSVPSVTTSNPNYVLRGDR